MPYWLGHALQDHADETLDGHFISPVTNETYVLSWSERAIAEAMFRRLAFTRAEPWGDRFGYKISRALVEQWVGKPIGDKLWRVAILNLEHAGLLEVIREGGRAHTIKPGKLIRCDQRECQDPEHYPEDYPLPKVSTPLPKDRGDLSKGEETPNLSPDINNLNNSLITSNTVLGVQEVLEVPGSLPGATANPVEPKAKPANEELQEWLDSLPENWVKWSWISAELKGYDKPTKKDLAHAEEVYKETGLDLEPNGTWQDGRANPRPAQATKQYN